MTRPQRGQVCCAAMLEAKAADCFRRLFLRFILSFDWQSTDQGERLADADNTELNNLLSEALAKKADYESLSTYGMAGFILTLIAGFVGAFILEKKENKPPFKQTHYASRPIQNTRK